MHIGGAFPVAHDHSQPLRRLPEVSSQSVPPTKLNAVQIFHGSYFARLQLRPNGAIRYVSFIIRGLLNLKFRTCLGPAILTVILDRLLKH